MSVETAVKSWLDQLCGAVHPGILPPSPTYPAIVYSVTDDQSPRTLGGAVVSGSVDIDVNVYGPDYLEVKTLGRAIKASADALGGPQTNWHGINLHSARCRAVRDLPIESDTKNFHAVAEITLFIKE